MATTAKMSNFVNMNANPSPKQYAPTPTKRPTPIDLDHMTFEPTGKRKGWRLRSARDSYIKDIKFWETRNPDALPPLPPDTDPTTGAHLPPVIAYVTTLTSCGPLPKHRNGLDGAAVLLQSIRRNSHGWVPLKEHQSFFAPQYGGQGGRYRFRAYVFVDPSASPTLDSVYGECARFLQKIGYTVLHRAPLVPLFEVKDQNYTDESPFYREFVNSGYVGVQRPPSSLRPGENPNRLRMWMKNDGCCGYTELLKLHVYGMVEHKVAVHLDFDSLLLRPMDDLFDAMLGKGDEATRKKLPLANLPRTKAVNFDRPIDAVFTRDYNSVVHPNTPNAPVGYQGGFLAVRPSLLVLERYRTILKRANFLLAPRDGWGGKHGGFYGDVTFQGILPYYYEDVAPEGEHNEAELDRCIFNQMADNPRKSSYKFPRATPIDPVRMGFHDTKVCRDGRKDCSDTDCQRVHPKDSITTHFTFCKKPWDCSEGLPGTVASGTCLGLLREWYAIRRELEDLWLVPPSDDAQAFYRNDETIAKVHASRKGILDGSQYFGYCDYSGEGGYHKLVEPDEVRT